METCKYFIGVFIKPWTYFPGLYQVYLVFLQLELAASSIYYFMIDWLKGGEVKHLRIRM